MGGEMGAGGVGLGHKVILNEKGGLCLGGNHR